MDFKDKQAIYLQIADLFCENILSGKWKSGEKIPSIREMAVKLEVNPNTAMRTYSFLQDQDIIFNKRGIGYFVAEEGYQKTLNVVKNRFIENELPEFFKTMNLIDLSIDELLSLYNNYKTK